MNYVFIKFAYSSSAYRFLVHKSSIEDIHRNTIITLRNVIFFKDVFLWKEARENHSLKRMIETSSSNHRQ